MKRILCATDLSEASDEALRQAHEIATSAGALLAVCHVVPDMQRVHPLFPQRHGADATLGLELERRVHVALTDRTKAVTGRGPEQVMIFVEIGAGYAEIVRRAEAWGADLVVAASRGHTGITRMLLGSVASQLVRHAHCPVLIARVPDRQGVVLAATDLSDAALPAVEAAHREALRRKSDLVVVHAVDLAPSSAMWALGSPFGISYAVPSSETLAEVRAAARMTLDGALARFGATGTSVIVEGDPAACILREADARGAELVVVGTRGRTGIARVVLGSVAEKVIQNAACSVLAVRLGTT